MIKLIRCFTDRILYDICYEFPEEPGQTTYMGLALVPTVLAYWLVAKGRYCWGSVRCVMHRNHVRHCRMVPA